MLKTFSAPQFMWCCSLTNPSSPITNLKSNRLQYNGFLHFVDSCVQCACLPSASDYRSWNKHKFWEERMAILSFKCFALTVAINGLDFVYVFWWSWVRISHIMPSIKRDLHGIPRYRQRNYAKYRILRHDHLYIPSNFYKMTNKMQLCSIIYCSLTALHVSSDIFARHQEHLNCNYSFWFYSRASLSAAVMAQFPLSHVGSLQRQTWVEPEAVITVKMLLMTSDNIARNM